MVGPVSATCLKHFQYQYCITLRLKYILGHTHTKSLLFKLLGNKFIQFSGIVFRMQFYYHFDLKKNNKSPKYWYLIHQSFSHWNYPLNELIVLNSRGRCQSRGCRAENQNAYNLCLPLGTHVFIIRNLKRFSKLCRKWKCATFHVR